MHRLRETTDRLLDMLATAMGPHIAEYIEDPLCVEIMLNPDSKLWIDRLGEGRSCTGRLLESHDAERIIYLIASAVNDVCNAAKPVLSAEIPGSGSRFQAILPPVTSSPTFTIRKKARLIFTLDDYVRDGVLTEIQRERILRAVRTKENILIVGGTGSGKTTLANAILREIATTGDRVVLIEDTVELQCAAEDTVALRAKDGVVTINDLLKATMRLRPDRIIVGEVRGGEALTLLKAMNTGHPGSLSTIHANSARGGLIRLEQLIQEAVVSVSRQLIAEAMNLLIYIERVGTRRRVKEIQAVTGTAGGDYLLTGGLREISWQEEGGQH
jgi:type IV secretion system protein TrbB